MIKVHKEIGNGIKLIGENGIRRPILFIGLVWHNKSGNVWAKIVDEIDSNIFCLFYGGRDNGKIKTFPYLTIYKSLYTTQTYFFASENSAYKIPEQFRKDIPVNGICCEKIGAEWFTWETNQIFLKEQNIYRMQVEKVINFPEFETKPIIIIEEKVKNNDGRNTCAWCNAPTEKKLGLYTYYDICTKCKR